MDGCRVHFRSVVFVVASIAIAVATGIVHGGNVEYPSTVRRKYIMAIVARAIARVFEIFRI